MNVLALDLGTRTGWAVRLGTRRESGVQTFDVKRGESPGMRYVRFRKWLDDMDAFGPLDLIVYEQFHHRGGPPTEVAAGFATRVLEHCAMRNVQHAVVHTMTLKKWTTGRGNADKAAMRRAVHERWGVDTASDDEADAVAILHWALHTYSPRR